MSADEQSVSETEADESFVRFQSSMYRVISFAGAAIIAIFGITLFVIGITLSPTPPPVYFIIDGIVTVAFLIWYLLGLRCRLDLADTWVHVATKYGDTHLERSQVNSIEPDLSFWGAIQWSGRPLILRYEHEDKPRVRRAYGCLPSDRQGQDAAIAELQRELGEPQDVEKAERLKALDERLATMTPEGDDERDAT